MLNDKPFLMLASSAARTATGNGEVLDLLQSSGLPGDRARQLLVQSDVTAVSGTSPSVTVTVQDSIDGGASWNTIGTFAAQTAINRAVIAIGLRGDAYPAGFRWPFNAKRVRIAWTISGTTPNIVFSVKGVLI